MSVGISFLPSMGPRWAFRESEDQIIREIFGQLDAGTRRLQTELDRHRRKADRLEVEVSNEKASKELLRQELAVAKGKNERYGYAILLINWEEATFDDELFKKPEHGGRVAAERVRQAIKVFLASCNVPGHHERSFKILAKFYANFDEFSKSLHEVGIIKSRGDLATFAKAFTDSYPEFDFVNTGLDKKKKMEWMLSYYLHQAQCKRIFFTPGHDDKFNESLRALRADHRSESDKLVLITPVSQNIRKHGFVVVNFSNVFLPEPLPAKEDHGASSNNERISTLCREMPRRISPHINPGPCGQEPPYSSSAAPCAPPMQRSVPKPNIQSKTTTVITRPPRVLWVTDKRVTEYEDRIDPDISSLRGCVRAFERRLDRLKNSGGKGFCNTYYIHGACKFGDRCIYEHNARLTAREMNGLRYKARTLPCQDGPKCRDFDCTSSHHCPWEKNCDREDCRFLHFGPDGPGPLRCIWEEWDWE